MLRLNIRLDVHCIMMSWCHDNDNIQGWYICIIIRRDSFITKYNYSMSQVPQNLFELYVEEIFSYLRLEINLLEHSKIGVMYGKRLFPHQVFLFQRRDLQEICREWKIYKVTYFLNVFFCGQKCKIFLHENHELIHRFCQWKNLELNIQLSMNDFSVHR